MPNQTTKPNDAAGAFGCILLLLFGGVICVWVYQKVDALGWIQHTGDSAITAQANWLVGESKDCYTYPIPVNPPKGEDIGYALGQVNCDNGPLHDMKIRFYGRRAQPEYGVVYWKCTREESGFECDEQYGFRR